MNNFDHHVLAAIDRRIMNQQQNAISLARVNISRFLGWGVSSLGPCQPPPPRSRTVVIVGGGC